MRLRYDCFSEIPLKKRVFRKKIDLSLKDVFEADYRNERVQNNPVPRYFWLRPPHTAETASGEAGAFFCETMTLNLTWLNHSKILRNCYKQKLPNPKRVSGSAPAALMGGIGGRFPIKAETFKKKLSSLLCGL